MKKQFIILLCLVLLCSLTVSSSAASFDMNAILDSTYAADGSIEIDEDDGAVFVYSPLSAEELSFVHTLEADGHYSYTDFDIIVVDAGTSEEYPVLRLWLYLWTNGDFYDVESVTFTVRDVEFTFGGLWEEDRLELDEEDGECRQEMLICFDTEGLRFFSELQQVSNLKKASKDWADYTIHTVFHGSEEIETELDNVFLSQAEMFWDLFRMSNALSGIGNVEGNPVEIRVK